MNSRGQISRFILKSVNQSIKIYFSEQ